MLIDPQDLRGNVARLEEIEKASLRLVTQAILDYRDVAVDIFAQEGDLVADNGLLQAKYNPTSTDTIWLAGRNAPTLGEDFRVRLSFARLKDKAPWRVQRIPVPPGVYSWDE